MIRMIKTLLLITLLPAAVTHAAAIFAPGNLVYGVRSDGTSLLIASNGADGGNTNYTDNFWPGNIATPATNESPEHAIDGVGQKYLNFAELNTGIMVSPGGSATVVGSLQVWTANDAMDRDPASYAVYGTNAALNGGGMALSQFTLISTGALNLPISRNAGGTAVLDAANSTTVTFANSTPYLNYLVIFPTVRTETSANSMQVAEIQLFTAVPEPGTAMLAGVGLTMLARRRRRRV